MMGVIPDEMWPDEFKDVDIVTSGEDKKLCSAWKRAKTKLTAGQQQKYQFQGVLAAVDKFKAGSFVGINPDLQKQMGGDFDGDHNFIFDANQTPKLFAAISNTKIPQSDKGFKPPKQFTSKDNASLGSSKFIINTRSGILEKYSNLMNQFLDSMDEEKRKELAAKIIDKFQEYDFEISKDDNQDAMQNGEPQPSSSTDDDNEGTIKSFLKLDKYPEDPQEQIKFLANIFSLGINIGTDIFKAGGDVEIYQDMAKIISRVFIEDNTLQAPYTKSLLRYLEEGYDEEKITEHLGILQQTQEYSICSQIMLNLLKDQQVKTSLQTAKPKQPESQAKRWRKERTHMPSSSDMDLAQPVTETPARNSVVEFPGPNGGVWVKAKPVPNTTNLTPTTARNLSQEAEQGSIR
jgi:hypothetical protein